MTILLLSLLALGVVCALLTLVFRRKGQPEGEIRQQETCATCDGTSSKCEQTCMMEAATRPIEYFDDEELDVYRDRPSNDYTEEETDQFADVLHTMRPDEVSAWLRSLHLRGIELPDALKDEAYMLAG